MPVENRLIRFLTGPPKWWRALLVLCLALLVWRVADRQGWWPRGVLALIGYGALLLPAILFPARLAAWPRSHPELDGALLGPLLFAGLVVVTPLPLWIDLLGGLVGVGVGVLLGRRRRRLLLRS